MNSKFVIAIAFAGVIVAAAAGGWFGGIYVSPIQFEQSQITQDEEFGKFKTEHGRFEHGQDERIDKMFITHSSDMREIEKALGEQNAKLAEVQATNKAILRELGTLNREIRRQR